MKLRKQTKRTQDSVFVGAWLPVQLVNLLDQTVQRRDSDRSKFIRAALKDKIQKVETV